MNLKRIIFCALCAVLPAMVAATLWYYEGVLEDWRRGEVLPVYDGDVNGFAIEAENLVKAGIPYNKELAKFGGLLVSQPHLYSTSGTEIFLSPDGLMKNIDPPVDAYVEENIKGITKFAEWARQNYQQTYVAIIPTASAIMQKNLPPYAQSVMVNQRQFIEDVYSGLSASATTVDIYSALWQRQNQYIYYRTENNLTPLGGHCVYAVMTSRLGLGRSQINQFDIEYANNAFYGDLYRESGYRDVVPDSISLFRYGNQNRVEHEFLVVKTDGESYKTYHTLFPKSAAQAGGELDVFFGGVSAVTDIYTASQYSSSLLVFGDKTALAYLPFIANNVKRVTLVDLFHDKSRLSSVNIEEYDKILFAYGVESFMHTNNPSRAAAWVE